MDLRYYVYFTTTDARDKCTYGGDYFTKDEAEYHWIKLLADDKIATAMIEARKS